MAKLTNKNGEKINIDLNKIFELRAYGNHTILKGRFGAETLEFEVLENYQTVTQLLIAVRR